MKIREPTIKIFQSDLEKLEKTIIPRLNQRITNYLECKERGETGYWMESARSFLVAALDEYREHISHMYDFMGDRGLFDKVNNGN